MNVTGGERPILVSIIVPVWNRVKYLRAAIRSLLAENIEGLEIIVSDDGSTDGSLGAIADCPVVVIRAAVPSGPSAARNRALPIARGRYLAFLDSDDLLVTDGLRWRIALLEERPDVQAVMGEMAGIVGASGESLGGIEQVVFNQYVKPPAVITKAHLMKGGWFPCQLGLLMFRRTVYETIGGFDETLKTSEDLDYFLRLTAIAPIAYVDKPTISYRVHDANLSGHLSPAGFRHHAQTRADSLLVLWGHRSSFQSGNISV